MLDTLIAALNSYSRGEADKSDTTHLDVLIAQIRGTQALKNQFSIELIEEALARIDLNAPHMWEAVAILIEKLGIRSTDLAATIEQRLQDSDCPLLDRFYAVRAFSLSGGGVDAFFLKKEFQLKSGAPALWLDLAIPAFADDSVGITSAVQELLSATPNALSWTDLRKRLPKLRLAYGANFNSAVLSIADSLPNLPAKKGWLEAADKRYGTSLAQSYFKQNEKPKSVDFSSPRNDQETKMAKFIDTRNFGPVISVYQRHPQRLAAA